VRTCVDSRDRAVLSGVDPKKDELTELYSKPGSNLGDFGVEESCKRDRFPIFWVHLTLLMARPKSIPKTSLCAGIRAIGVFAFITEGSRVLLVQPKGKAQWTLPGGKLKARETIIKGLRREVKEESGCAIEDIRSCGLILRENRRYLGLVFSARVKRVGQLPRDTEIAKTQWFQLARLPRRLGPQAKAFLRQQLQDGIVAL
jgi:8-oxo-dGTP diphosphatase